MIKNTVDIIEKLKHPASYEIINPLSVRFEEEKFILSRHSGRAGFKRELEKLGIIISNASLDNLFLMFKKIAKKKKIVTKEQLLMLINKFKKSFDA